MAACPRPSSTAVVVVVWGGTFPFTLLNVDRGLAGHTSSGNRYQPPAIASYLPA